MLCLCVSGVEKHRTVLLTVLVLHNAYLYSIPCPLQTLVVPVKVWLWSTCDFGPIFWIWWSLIKYWSHCCGFRQDILVQSCYGWLHMHVRQTPVKALKAVVAHCCALQCTLRCIKARPRAEHY